MRPLSIFKLTASRHIAFVLKFAANASVNNASMKYKYLYVYILDMNKQN